jgi:hypothetical protein
MLGNPSAAWRYFCTCFSFTLYMLVVNSMLG